MLVHCVGIWCPPKEIRQQVHPIPSSTGLKNRLPKFHAHFPIHWITFKHRLKYVLSVGFSSLTLHSLAYSTFFGALIGNSTHRGYAKYPASYPLAMSPNLEQPCPHSHPSDSSSPLINETLTISLFQSSDRFRAINSS
jgi:hypothetical protein